MNIIYFNPYKDDWVCEFDSDDIRRRECFLIILESRGMKILSSTRSHIRINAYPHIYHSSIRTRNDISGYIKNYSRKNIIVVSYEFLVYYFSPKYLF